MGVRKIVVLICDGNHHYNHRGELITDSCTYEGALKEAATQGWEARANEIFCPMCRTFPEGQAAFAERKALNDNPYRGCSSTYIPGRDRMAHGWEEGYRSAWWKNWKEEHADQYSR